VSADAPASALEDAGSVPSSVKYSRIVVFVPATLHEWLRERATSREVSVSTLVRFELAAIKRTEAPK